MTFFESAEALHNMVGDKEGAKAAEKLSDDARQYSKLASQLNGTSR